MKNASRRKWADDEVMNWYRMNRTRIYSNPQDGNIVVRKPRGLGWSVNWANPYAYLLEGAILAVAFVLVEIFT